MGLWTAFGAKAKKSGIFSMALTFCAPIYKRLERTYPDETELDNAVADLSQALTVHDDVYMELGMKAGARLLYQLLLTDDQT